MKLRQRILYLRRHGQQDRAPHFGQLCNDLQKSIAATLGEERAQEALRGWPSVDWQDDAGALTVSTWESVRDPDLQLLDVELALHDGNRTWTVSLLAGTQCPDEIVLQEVCRLTPDVSQPPIDAIPDVLDFLADYRCQDDDNLDAGRVYTVAWGKIFLFGDLIRGHRVDRMLPVVVISHDNESRRPLVEPEALASRFCGLAHVMRLDPKYRWNAANLDAGHPCFNGAIRVYMPGYADGDRSSAHRYWHPDWIAEYGEDVLIGAVVRYVLEKNWSREVQNEVLAALVQERDEDAMRSEVQRQVESVRQRMQEELATHSEESEVLESFYRDYDELASKYDRLVADNNRLRQQRKEMADEIRTLKYRLGQQWAYDDPPPDLAALGIEVLLSAQARVIHDELDMGEKSAVDSQLLGKLLNGYLREHQTEPIQAVGGACYVYPRKRSASGRRVIYWREGTQIMVCEIFANHDGYEDARDRGFDLSRYTGFEPWQPDDANVMRETASQHAVDEIADLDGP